MPRVLFALVVLPLLYPAGILLFADQLATWGALMVGTFTVGATIFVGVPLLVVCIRRGWLSPPYAIVSGSLAGLLCSSLFSNGSLKTVIGFAAIGAIHGLVFWFAAFWRNTQIMQSARNVKSVA